MGARSSHFVIIGALKPLWWLLVGHGQGHVQRLHKPCMACPETASLRGPIRRVSPSAAFKRLQTLTCSIKMQPGYQPQATIGCSHIRPGMLSSTSWP